MGSGTHREDAELQIQGGPPHHGHVPPCKPCLPTHPFRGSTTIARGCVIFPSISVFRVWAAFSSRATLMVFLGPSSVQYRLFPIQSTAIPSTLWMPLEKSRSMS